ncbi:hypothetical protein EV673_2290 [Limnobacter thiooxidans]|uniref:Uncharacterized protein n=1 Tax=Limnobacter thiooxidans TaxID=131080 RepID=A0AA86MBT9_9BURK|nr:hypothetical protein EV673_2290 [Limnobacter thiooxidans]BET27043.1 hypothetical protein RGQ30_25440 [Limnobacter thiooxidans]
MWKLIVAFLLFAGLSMFVIMQGGDNLNMAGEQHGGGDTPHENAAPSQAVPTSGAVAEQTPPAAVAPADSK